MSVLAQGQGKRKRAASKNAMQTDADADQIESHAAQVPLVAESGLEVQILKLLLDAGMPALCIWLDRHCHVYLAE